MAEKKIYLSPERRPAPHGKYWGMEVYEHDVCREIAALLCPMLVRCGFAVKTAEDAPNIVQRVAEAAAWGADCYLPIHTNASTADVTKEGTAQGPLVIRYGASGGVSDRACTMVYNRLMEIYPRDTRRGVIANTGGFYEIDKTPMLSIYPELAFHDNGEDAHWLVNSRAEIAEALCRGLCDWYGVEFAPETASFLPPRTQETPRTQLPDAAGAGGLETLPDTAGAGGLETLPDAAGTGSLETLLAAAEAGLRAARLALRAQRQTPQDPSGGVR